MGMGLSGWVMSLIDSRTAKTESTWTGSLEAVAESERLWLCLN